MIDVDEDQWAPWPGQFCATKTVGFKRLLRDVELAVEPVSIMPVALAAFELIADFGGVAVDDGAGDEAGDLADGGDWGLGFPGRLRPWWWLR